MTGMSDHVNSTPRKPGHGGGAPPHTDNRIRQAARGQGQVGLFKTTRERHARSLFWRSDSLEHGLNISETPRSCALQRAPVRWTLNLKTNHLWSLGPCQCRTTEQRLQSRAELSRWRHAAEVPRRSTNRPRDTRNKELNSRGKTKPKRPACFNGESK